MNDLKNAKRLLTDGDYTCVLCFGDEIITSNERGVKPLLDYINSNRDYSAFSAADKVIGKAAAFLYAVLGIKKVYAKILSKSAESVFKKYRIKIEYSELTDAIINRSGTGYCPIEQAVYDIEDKEFAVEAIKNKLAELKNN